MSPGVLGTIWISPSPVARGQHLAVRGHDDAFRHLEQPGEPGWVPPDTVHRPGRVEALDALLFVVGDPDVSGPVHVDAGGVGEPTGRGACASELAEERAVAVEYLDEGSSVIRDEDLALLGGYPDGSQELTVAGTFRPPRGQEGAVVC